MKRSLSFVLILCGALLAFVGTPTSAAAADRYVCAAGDATCGGTPAYTTLALAITASPCGDTVFLKAGETFTFRLVLADKGCAASLNTTTGVVTGNPITIRSSGTDLNWPPWGQRVKPDNLAAGTYAIVKSNTTLPVLQTAVGASGYVIKFLKFEENVNGADTMMRLGINDSTQEFVSEQPEDIIVDRIWMRGHPFLGQKRGIEPNGKNISIVNSYLEGFKTFGNDAQAIAAFNGTGPVLIENNYLEGAAENTIFGGATPEQHNCATVKSSPPPTSTVFTLENFRGTVDNDCDGKASAAAQRDHAMDVAIGDNVAVQIGVSGREWATVTAVSSNQITVDTDPITAGNQGFSVAPSTGADVRWGSTLSDVTIRRNYFRKDPAWKNPILGTPTTLTATAVLGSGTLAAGTYYYKLVVYATGNEGQTINGAPSAEVSCVLPETGSCKVDWSAVANAGTYRVYGRSSGGQTGYAAVAAPTLTYTDSGSSLTTGTPPTKGKFWDVKTLFELKNCTRCLIEFNIMENGWQGTQGGPNIWLKGNTNQPHASGAGGEGEFTVGDLVTFRYNVVRNVPGGFLLVGNEAVPYSDPLQRGKPGSGWVIENNLLYNSGSAYNWPLPQSNENALQISNAWNGIAIRHNTFIHNQAKAVYVVDRSLSGVGNTMTDNIFAYGSYGVFNDLGQSGVTAWTNKGGTSFTNNVMAGGSASQYPGNLTPTIAQWQAAFVNFGGAAITDYALAAGHAWRTAGTGGTVLGADIAGLAAGVAGVIEGVTASTPVIQTISLTGGTAGTAYSSTLAAAGGTTPYSWTLASGSLPTGLTLNSFTGQISGTPSSAGSASFTVKVTDAGMLFSSQPMTLDIAAAAPNVSITTSALPDVTVGQSYSTILSAAGGPSPTHLWAVASGQLPTGLFLTASTGAIAGTPTVSGIYTPTFQVTSGASSSTKQLTIRVLTPGGGGSSSIIDPAPRPTRWNGQSIFTFSDTLPPTVADRVRAKDFWISDDASINVITATSPTVTYKAIRPPHTVIYFANSFTAQADSNVPSGGRELGGGTYTRQQLDLSYYTQCRLTVHKAGGGISAQDLAIQYFNGSTWQGLDDATNPRVTDLSVGTNVTTAWATLAAAAKNDVLVRAFITDGNGTADPAFGVVALECRQ